MTVELYEGDCLDVMADMPDNSVDAIVTDPPYGLGFMGKAWDDLPPGLPWAQECLRVLRPGGHLLAFGGTRTWHRLAVAVEDAGFEVRDSIAWLYGSGFPKSQDVSKAIDKLDASAERRSRALEFTSWFRSTGITRQKAAEVSGMASVTNHYFEVTAQPAVATADIFDKLRPYLPEVPERIEELVRQRTVESQNYAARPITQEAKEALRSGEVITFDQRSSTARERRDIAHTLAAQQWSGWGTALKPAFEPIVVARKPLQGTVAANVQQWGTGALNIDATRVGTGEGIASARGTRRSGGIMGASEPLGGWAPTPGQGRWPTNVVLDDTVAVNRNADGGRKKTNIYGDYGDPAGADVGYGGEGGPSRFFPTFRYQAKAPARERPSYVDDAGNKIAHSTVKPLDLMRWLVRLVTPPGGTVLDPFAGSGATVEACMLEGFGCVAIEREAEYLPLIRIRMERSA